MGMDIFMMVTRWIFVLALGYYVIVNLQWYNYSISRVLFKHHKQKWHLLYFVLPVLYFVLIPNSIYFYLGLYLYVAALIFWTLQLSKKLVLTKRVKRFFALYIVFIALCEFLPLESSMPILKIVNLAPLLITLLLTQQIEGLLLGRYKENALEVLKNMPNLTIIAITASYGKTSLKNFLLQVLQKDFNVYATPRSVNTLAGIIADINQNLPPSTNIYIVESGARKEGDIKEIVEFLKPQIVVVGKIGLAHLEYFKTPENIYKTKYEILQSPRLQKAYIYNGNTPPKNFQNEEKIFYFPQEVSEVEATLEGTKFSFMQNGIKTEFKTEILGDFNVINISAAITIARDFGIPEESIIQKVQKLQSVNHRLNKIVANGKIILDDSYNGNLEGMLEAIRLASLHQGRKIIVTPGLVEISKEANITLAKAIDEVFDIIIITGELNLKIFKEHIHKPQKIILKDKADLENILKLTTKEGDLILFANDAPNYI